jgi:hypothetical protein
MFVLFYFFIIIIFFSYTQLFVCLYLSQTSLYMFNDNKVIIIIINTSNLCLIFYLITFLYAIDVNFVNINYRFPIKVYYRICTLRHIRIEIINGSQNVFWDINTGNSLCLSFFIFLLFFFFFHTHNCLFVCICLRHVYICFQYY